MRSLTLVTTVLMVSPLGVAAANVCPGGRFLVRSGNLATGQADVHGARAVVIGPPEISVEGLCEPTHGRLTVTRRRTHVAASWRACAGLEGKVHLRGHIEEGCEVLRGLFIARRSRVKVRFAATRSTCGDRLIDPVLDEQCDDGNQLDGDGCSAACRWEFCGDGVTQPGEECDDGNQADGDGCNHGCTLPRCGNGIREGGEECDGFDVGGYACQSLGAAGGVLGCRQDCRFDVSACQTCGNGRREGSEVCDGADGGGQTCESRGYPEGGVLGCQLMCRAFDTRACFVCGNGRKEGPEACDVNDLGGATCDGPGERGGRLACTPDCQIDRSPCYVCGNGRLDPGETCDDGALNGESDYGCSVSCQSLCGDGVVARTEECDDGNRFDGDGCSRHCFLEALYAGGGGEPYDECFVEWGVEGVPTDGTITCRDGDPACDRDLVSGSCTFEYFMCFNETIPVIFDGSRPPCFNAQVERVALLYVSLTGATALDPPDAEQLLDMVSHVLGRFGTVTRGNDGSVTVDPPVGTLGNCGGATLVVPAGEQRMLAVATTDAETQSVDEDRIRFDCAPASAP